MDEAKFLITEEVQKAVAAALATIEGRTFSQRHPELGKMVNCRVCGTRHRVNERKCEQVFTCSIGDYEYFRKNAKGDLVPDYRTAIRPESKQSRNQVYGAPIASNFSKPRYRPHPSKNKLLFIQRVREIFVQLGFPLDEKDENFQKNLEVARKKAVRQLRAEHSLSSRAARLMRNTAHRINRGSL